MNVIRIVKSILKQNLSRSSDYRQFADYLDRLEEIALPIMHGCHQEYVKGLYDGRVYEDNRKLRMAIEELYRQLLTAPDRPLSKVELLSRMAAVMANHDCEIFVTEVGK